MATRPLAAAHRAYICPSCHTTRSLHTTSRLLAISPESPRYIDIPSAPQQTSTPRQRMKGILPVPRDVMRRRTPESVSASIHDPVEPKTPHTPAERFAASMTALRKSNLRSGSAALHARRIEAQTTSRARSAANRAARTAALDAPTHFAERLTTASLDPSVAAELARYAKKTSLPDPGRAERVAAARKKLDANNAALQAKREAALHSLYMNARTFIVDEAGLNEAIDNAFGTPDAPHQFSEDNKSLDVPSMWAKGPPRKMSALASGSFGAHRDVAGDEMEMLMSRVRRMAEGVTGGKMDSSILEDDKKL